MRNKSYNEVPRGYCRNYKKELLEFFGMATLEVFTFASLAWMLFIF